MSNEDPNPDSQRKHFDQWAPHYDDSVKDTAKAELFPFAGYDGVLETLCQELNAEPGMAVLDLGTGTGNLARRIQDLGCRLWGTDLSATMLEEARTKLPKATLVEADLAASWPSEIDGPFDRIVSAYVLHHFDLETKVSILLEAAKRLAPEGKILIGDIAFATQGDREDAKQKWHDRWDHEEHYWAAEETLDAAHQVGLRGKWVEISICAGIFNFELDADAPGTFSRT